eukprot:gene9536-6693_t
MSLAVKSVAPPKEDGGAALPTGESKAALVKETLKTYAWHMLGVAIELGIPLATFLVASMALSNPDPERFGLGWLQWTRLGNDLKRETTYPAHDPATKAERHRMEAARAAEQVVASHEKYEASPLFSSSLLHTHTHIHTYSVQSSDILLLLLGIFGYPSFFSSLFFSFIMWLCLLFKERSFIKKTSEMDRDEPEQPEIDREAFSSLCGHSVKQVLLLPFNYQYLSGFIPTHTFIYLFLFYRFIYLFVCFLSSFWLVVFACLLSLPPHPLRNACPPPSAIQFRRSLNVSAPGERGREKERERKLVRLLSLRGLPAVLLSVTRTLFIIIIIVIIDLLAPSTLRAHRFPTRSAHAGKVGAIVSPGLTPGSSPTARNAVDDFRVVMGQTAANSVSTSVSPSATPLPQGLAGPYYSTGDTMTDILAGASGANPITLLRNGSGGSPTAQPSSAGVRSAAPLSSPSGAVSVQASQAEGVSIIIPNQRGAMPPGTQQEAMLLAAEEEANADRVHVKVEGFYEQDEIGGLIPSEMPRSRILYVLTASDGRDMMFKTMQYTLLLIICLLKKPHLFSPGAEPFLDQWALRFYYNYNTIRHARSLFKVGRWILNIFAAQAALERLGMMYRRPLDRLRCALIRISLLPLAKLLRLRLPRRCYTTQEDREREALALYGQGNYEQGDSPASGTSSLAAFPDGASSNLPSSPSTERDEEMETAELVASQRRRRFGSPRSLRQHHRADDGGFLTELHPKRRYVAGKKSNMEDMLAGGVYSHISKAEMSSPTTSTASPGETVDLTSAGDVAGGHPGSPSLTPPSDSNDGILYRGPLKPRVVLSARHPAAFPTLSPVASPHARPSAVRDTTSPRTAGDDSAYFSGSFGTSPPAGLSSKLPFFSPSPPPAALSFASRPNGTAMSSIIDFSFDGAESAAQHSSQQDGGGEKPTDDDDDAPEEDGGAPPRGPDNIRPKRRGGRLGRHLTPPRRAGVNEEDVNVTRFSLSDGMPPPMDGHGQTRQNRYDDDDDDDVALAPPRQMMEKTLGPNDRRPGGRFMDEDDDVEEGATHPPPSSSAMQDLNPSFPKTEQPLVEGNRTPESRSSLTPPPPPRMARRGTFAPPAGGATTGPDVDPNNNNNNNNNNEEEEETDEDDALFAHAYLGPSGTGRAAAARRDPKLRPAPIVGKNAPVLEPQPLPIAFGSGSDAGADIGQPKQEGEGEGEGVRSASIFSGSDISLPDSSRGVFAPAAAPGRTAGSPVLLQPSLSNLMIDTTAGGRRRAALRLTPGPGPLTASATTALLHTPVSQAPAVATVSSDSDIRLAQPSTTALPANCRKTPLQFRTTLMLLFLVRSLSAAVRRILRDVTLVCSERFFVLDRVERHRQQIHNTINVCWFIASSIDLILSTTRVFKQGWLQYAAYRQNVRCRCGCKKYEDPADLTYRHHGFVTRRKTDLFFPPLDMDYGAPVTSNIGFFEAADPASMKPSCARCGCIYDVPVQRVYAAENPAHTPNTAGPAGANEVETIVRRASGSAGAAVVASVAAAGASPTGSMRSGGDVSAVVSPSSAGSPVSRNFKRFEGLCATMADAAKEAHANRRQSRDETAGVKMKTSGRSSPADGATVAGLRTTAAVLQKGRQQDEDVGLLLVPWVMRRLFNYAWLLTVHPNFSSTLLMHVRYMAEWYLAYQYTFGSFECHVRDAPLGKVVHSDGAVAGLLAALVVLTRVVKSAPS